MTLASLASGCAWSVGADVGPSVTSKGYRGVVPAISARLGFQGAVFGSERLEAWTVDYRVEIREEATLVYGLGYSTFPRCPEPRSKERCTHLRRPGVGFEGGAGLRHDVRKEGEDHFGGEVFAGVTFGGPWPRQVGRGWYGHLLLGSAGLRLFADEQGIGFLLVAGLRWTYLNFAGFGSASDYDSDEY